MHDYIKFHKGYYEAIEDLSNEDQLIIYKAICKYGLYEEETELGGISKTIWKIIKPLIDGNHENSRNGKKGGRPPKDDKAKPKTDTKQPTKKSKEQALEEAYNCLNKPLLNKIVTNDYEDINSLTPDDFEIMQDVIADCSTQIDVAIVEQLKEGYKTLREYCKKKENIYKPTVGKSKHNDNKDTDLTYFLNNFFDTHDKKKFMINGQECYVNGDSLEIVLNKSRLEKPNEHEHDIMAAIFNKQVEFI